MTTEATILHQDASLHPLERKDSLTPSMEPIHTSLSQTGVEETTSFYHHDTDNQDMVDNDLGNFFDMSAFDFSPESAPALSMGATSTESPLNSTSVYHQQPAQSPMSQEAFIDFEQSRLIEVPHFDCHINESRQKAQEDFEDTRFSTDSSGPILPFDLTPYTLADGNSAQPLQTRYGQEQQVTGNAVSYQSFLDLDEASED